MLCPHTCPVPSSHTFSLTPPLPHTISQLLSSNPIVRFLSIHTDTMQLFLSVSIVQAKIAPAAHPFRFYLHEPFVQLGISLFLFLCSTALFVMQLDSRYSSLLSSLLTLSHIFPRRFLPLDCFAVFSHSTTKSPCRLFSVQRIYQTPSWRFPFPL